MLSTVQSLAIPLLIGLLAAAAALPLAWWLSRTAPRRFNSLIAPICVMMMMPPYLAFAGWSLLRAPGSWLGDHLAAAPAWLNLGFSQALAILGLALWSSPLAVITLTPACRAIERQRLESLRLDGAGFVRTSALVLWWLRPALTLATAAVALLMVGSAVPLHLAQFRTISIELWSSLMLRPAWPTVLEAWPVILLALAAGWLISRAALRAAPDDPHTTTLPPRPSATTRLSGALGLCLWLAGTVVPLLLFARVTPAWPLTLASVQRVLPAFGNSLFTAAILMATILALGCLTSAATHAGGTLRRIASVALGFLIITSVLPGVLIGMILRLLASDIGRAIGFQPNDDALLLLAHALRFGIIPVATAWWLWASQPQSLKDTYALDTAGTRATIRNSAASPSTAHTTLRAWTITHARTEIPTLIFASLACGMLSLHEIEAAIMLQSPGSGTLSQRVLDLLHYNRDTDLASIATILIGSSLALSLLAALLVGKRKR